MIVIKGKGVKWMRGLFLKYKFSKGTKILYFFFNARALIISRKKKKGRTETRMRGKRKREEKKIQNDNA